MIAPFFSTLLLLDIVTSQKAYSLEFKEQKVQKYLKLRLFSERNTFIKRDNKVVISLNF